MKISLFLLTLKELFVIFFLTESTNVEENYYVDINKQMKSGYTPLHLAVIHGCKEICQLLLNCEPVVTLRYNAIIIFFFFSI